MNYKPHMKEDSNTYNMFNFNFDNGCHYAPLCNDI